MNSSSVRMLLRGGMLLACLSLVGCAAAVPPLLLAPEPSPRSATYYQHGQPIASASGESTSVLVSADDCTLFGTAYLRVWLLYFNRSGRPVLLDPVHAVTARASFSYRNRPELRSRQLDVPDEPSGDSTITLIHVGKPELPYKLLADAENAKSRAQIAAVFGGALQSGAAAMETRSTTITSSGGEVATINDRAEKLQARQDAIDRRTAGELADANQALQMFTTSFNSGALRKNTVFPQSGVNGYLYIPLHPFWDKHGYQRWPASGTTYTVSFDLPGFVDSLTFAPEAGE